MTAQERPGALASLEDEEGGREEGFDGEAAFEGAEARGGEFDPFGEATGRRRRMSRDLRREDRFALVSSCFACHCSGMVCAFA